jgi:hypothetical protein
MSEKFFAGKTYVFDDPSYDVLELYSPYEDIVVKSSKTRKPIMLLERAGVARWWALTDKGRFIVFEDDMIALQMWQLEHLDQMINNES